MAFDNEKHTRDQGSFHRPTGIGIHLEELRPLTAAVLNESVNTGQIVATSLENGPDNNEGNNDGNNTEKTNISYTAKKNFAQGEHLFSILLLLISTENQN